MASNQLFLSSDLLNPVAFSLLCPIAFFAYGSLKSTLPLLRSVASFPNSMPPLRRMVTSSPEPMPPDLLRSTDSSPKPPLIRLVAPSLIGLSAYRSFNSMPASSAYYCFNSMPTFSAHNCFNSRLPLLPPVVSSPNSSPKSPLLGVAATSLIASYTYRTFNSMPDFSAYNGFNSMPPPLTRPLTYRMPDTPSGPKSLSNCYF